MIGSVSFLCLAASFVTATPIVYDGRAPLNLTAADIDAFHPPYPYIVKGSQNASQYVHLLGNIFPPTPLWNPSIFPFPHLEQAISVSIDNSSVFVPGGNPANAQYGFRRTEAIARGADPAPAETGTTVFHFSIAKDDLHPLNYAHEYQIVFIEPNDGSHVFGIQLGSPFTYPTASHLPVANAHNLKVLDHALNIVFSTSFDSLAWHNFAVQVDWDNRTLGVFYSKNGDKLKQVTKHVVPNLTATAGDAGKGDFHFGVLKLPLANPADTPAQAGDVVHRGLQEGTKEALYYSGVFVESVAKGVSVGYGSLAPKIV